MATEALLVENLKDTPDVAVLKQMENPVVVVTKISPTGKKGANQLVVNGAIGLDWNAILGLHDQLPTGVIPNSGPGLYKFEVTDQNSTAKMSWQIRLGSNSVESPGPSEAPVRSPYTGLGLPPVPPFQPQQQQFRPAPPAPDAQDLGNGWRYNPSLELLTAPDGTMHTWRKNMPLPTIVPQIPQQTPQTQYQATQLPGFGALASPELEIMRQTLAATQAALTEAREREKESARQAEIRALQEQMTKALEESNKRFEALVATLAGKPRAEDDRVRELEQRLAEKDRMDSLRNEMKAQVDGLAAIVREGAAHKGPDPIIPLLTQMLTDQRHSSDANIQVMRDMANAERAAAKDQVLTPERIFGMLERQSLLTKDSDKTDVVGKVLSGVDMLFERMSRLNQMERELSGGASGGVNWMDVIREVGSRAGSAFQMYQATKAKESNAQVATAQANIATAQATIAAARARARSAPAAVPAPAQPRSAEVLASAAAPAPQNPPVVDTTAKVKPPTVKIVPPQLADATLAELRALFRPEADEVFFGDFLQYVAQLREEIDAKPGEVSVEDIAGFILEARSFIADEAAKGNVPHAAELLVANQLAYVVERILPAANEGLRSEVLKALLKKLAEEADAARIAAAAGPAVS